MKNIAHWLLRLSSTTGVLVGHSLLIQPVAGQNSESAAYQGATPYTAPKYWQETIVHEDLSQSRLLVFQTIPGVQYTIETSNDLSQWTPVDTRTGGGEQVIVPMVQMKPPPVPEPPPTSPLPVTNFVWMMMQKATVGGIVLYWTSYNSVTHKLSFQSHHFQNITLDPEWEEYFVYVRKFENTAFSITHPHSLSIAPPDTEHSAEDLAMLTLFENNFATMNSEVHDQLPSVRYIPPPAPPADPNGRGFFRILADWSVDSDQDSIPDWEEIAMMAGVAGVGEDGTFLLTGTPNDSSSPFNADTNGNGTPDNEELDFDQDQIPRSEDADPLDGAIAWKKTLPTRYALFDVPLDYYANGYPIWPLSINSQGMVLFENGVYYGNSFHDLPYATNMTDGRAHAINDKGMILGYAKFESNQWTPTQAVWPSPTGQPGLVSKGVMNASNTYDLSYDLLKFGSAYGNDGSFIAETYEYVTSTNGFYYKYINKELWADGENGEYTHDHTGTVSSYCKSKDIHWGWNLDDHLILTAPDGGGDLGKNNFDKYNFVGGTQAVMSGGDTPSIFRIHNTWKQSSNLGTVLDISDTGIARVKKSRGAEKIPDGLGFWMNSKFYSLETMVPHLPDDYKGGDKVAVRGMANKGHIVLTMDPGDPYMDDAKCAVGFPCAVKDDTSDSVRQLYKDSDQDTVPFTGVDDVSITADKPDAAADNKIWIMAPIGTESVANDVKIQIPVSTDNPLTLEATNVDGVKTITEENQQISLRGTGAATTDEWLKLKLTGNTALNAPIGVKAMKRRKVNVTVTPVGLKKTDGSVIYPKRLPSQEHMTKYLNKTYQLQLNAEIVVTYKDPVSLQFSNMTETDLHLDPNDPNTVSLETFIPHTDGGTFDFMSQSPPGEQGAFAALKDNDADINVFFVGGISAITVWSPGKPTAGGYSTWLVSLATGISERKTNTAWVSDTRLDQYPVDNDTPEEKANYERLQMRTTAHEMGHLIVKYGHCDEGDGAAPLPGTDHDQRLMRAGGTREILCGNRLVKGEWDEAEKWFISRNK